MSYLNVILVGSNPLPCYIQAAYVLDKCRDAKEKESLPVPDKILFVATNETQKYINCIENILEESDLPIQYQDRLILNNGYDAKEIEKAVKKKIESMHETEDITGILLNFTGGTKSMAIYATMAVRNLSFYGSISSSVTECYVDPDKNKLRCINASKETEHLYPEIADKDLRDFVKLRIDHLVRLHFGDAILKYSDLNDCGDNRNKYNAAFSQDQLEAAIEILSDTSDAFNEYQGFYNMFANNERRESRPARWERILDEKMQMMDGFNFKLKKLKAEEIRPFASGDWLELYFYKALLCAKKKLENTDQKHVETALSYRVKPVGSNKEFEVDILALRGYELTLFSVSMVGTDKGEEAISKSKWFEAVYRTEQMAGDHGKVAVVNFLKDDVIDDFKADLSTFNHEVEIYKRSELADFNRLVNRLVENLRL